MISLVQIVEAMEGPITVNDCVEEAQAPCMVNTCCFGSRNSNRVNLAVRNALNDVSLEDLIDPAQLLAPVDRKQMMDQKMPLARQSEMFS